MTDQTPDDLPTLSWSPYQLGDVQQICTEAATHLANGLQADRTLIVCNADQEYLVLGGKHGFPKFALYHNAPVSLTVLEEAALRGRTNLSGHAAEDHETPQTLTLQLSNAVSLICVPFVDAEGKLLGAIYGDTINREGAFRHNQLRYARQFAEWLGNKLTGAEDVPPPRPVERKVSAPAKPEQPEIHPMTAEEAEKQGLIEQVVSLIGRFERFLYYS